MRDRCGINRVLMSAGHALQSYSRKIPQEHRLSVRSSPQSIENSRGILKGNAHLGASKILDPFRP
jgi:hypothetical protein